MRAEIISVGTELLLGDVVDTNASFVARRLADMGIDVLRKSVVGDNVNRISLAIREALGRKADLVIVGGGLGPTADDVTREAVAGALSVGLGLEPRALAAVEAWFVRRGRPMVESNRRQAFLPDGAEMLPNSAGTAPGFIVGNGQAVVAALPGVPCELEFMFREELEPRLRKLVRAHDGDGRTIKSRVLKFVGIPESSLAEKVDDLLHKQNPTVAPLVGNGIVVLRITAKADGPEQALSLIAPVEEDIRRRAGRWLAATDDESIEQVVGRLLKEAGLTLAVAESCTGGLISTLITDVPGSSDYFDRGFVTYSNEAKRRLLGVRARTLREHGAVSHETCREMATGALMRAGTGVAVAVTGIAGPGGATASKPLGLVYVGVAGPGSEPRDGDDGVRVTVEEHHFAGPRDIVRKRAAIAALDLIRRRLLEGQAKHLPGKEGDIGGGSG